MSRRTLVALIGLPVLLGVACSHAKERAPEPRSTGAPRAPSERYDTDSEALVALDAADAAGSTQRAPQGPPGPVSAAVAMDAARKLVRTGQVHVEVVDADASSRRVVAIAESHGGYVADMSGSKDGEGARSANVTVRLDPRAFMAALDEIRALGKVEDESVTTRDLGRDYADLEARLRTKAAAADRMREIMASRTGTLNDVIAAEQQLTAILAEVERIEGERRWIDAQVALSTLTVRLTEPVESVDPERPRIAVLGPLGDAFAAARAHLVAVAAFVVYVGTLTGPMLAAAALTWIAARRLRPRAPARPAAPGAASP